MIRTKEELRLVLDYERKQYFNYMFPTFARQCFGKIKREPIMSIWKWQKVSRLADYYRCRVNNSPSILEKFAYVYYTYRRNRIGEKLGIEAETKNIAKGLMIFHYAGGIVINGNTVIGENCHLHGNNCLGNGGTGNLSCPVLGNNITIGVGAKIIGGVNVVDDVKVGAGAVVVKDILEQGVTVVGIPARIVKHVNPEVNR